MSKMIFSNNPNNNFQNNFTKSYNLNTNHPLIENSQEYVLYKKFVSIHSEDRDILNYPNSAEFEIELPEDMLNVAQIRLLQWTFPANYNTFSVALGNVSFSFKINNPYNPIDNGLIDVFYQRIYQALNAKSESNYLFVIENGFYNPVQMATELTNKLNFTVTKYLITYFTEQGWDDSTAILEANGGYNRFVVVYNNVSLKLWFGNTADGFILANEVGTLANINNENHSCVSGKVKVPDISNWGLAGYLGLPRCNTASVSTSPFVDIGDFVSLNGITVPRFFYGDVVPGDNGYWLLPDSILTESKVHWVEAYYKINLMGEAYIYMELNGQNCIDETQPFNISNFTLTTNKTNGIVNSAFAKIPVPSTPLSQWFDRDSIPYKYYYPPAERIRRLKIKLRYHNGQLCDFASFNYSFMLEFSLTVPQILRSSSTVVYPSVL
jgi:hypothetical protein